MSTINEMKKLAKEERVKKLMKEVLDDFCDMSIVADGKFIASEGGNDDNFKEVDRLTVELLKVVELKKIATILAERR
ncbi:MAG: hypothetical protein KJ774_03220 [Firmicutes bacterium]|nr:hypothetical protein [Bacillota bacterium]